MNALAIIKKNKIKRLPKIGYYILYFFIFAFLGWLLETFFSFYALGHFTKRGFLYGPICPIYGFGASILMISLSKYKKNSIKLFTYSAIIFTAFEYLVSFALDALFKLKWWDYTNEFFNLNGRVTIFYSFAWGIIALLFIHFVYPFVKKKLNIFLSKIPYRIQILTVQLLLCIILVDTVLSSIRYLHIS